MRGIFSKIMIGLFAISMLLMSSVCAPKCSAKVNTSVIKKTCTQFRHFLGYYTYYKIRSGDKVTFDFSKSKVRRNALRYINATEEKQTKSKMDRLSITLFGVKTSNYKKNVVGDWGEEEPLIRGYKISKKGSKYLVKAKFKSKYDPVGEPIIQITDIGTLTFVLKKNSKGKYGYIVKSITLTKI